MTLLFVGAYTENLGFVDGRAEGIAVFRMDQATGRLEFVQENKGIASPSFLALHPDRRYLYAVNETGQFQAKPGGSVSAFTIDPADGTLKLINQQSSHGTAPCHVSLDATGSYVLVANYGSGTVAVYPVRADGSLGGASDIVQHTGTGGKPGRPSTPHAHAAYPDPNNRFVLAVDLGLDQVLVYRLDLQQGKLLPNGFAKLAPGAGPRHLVFHPNGGFVYVINELDSTMTAFGYDAVQGQLTELQTLSTLPAGFSGRSACAEVAITANGKFLYGSNRFQDSLVIYAVNPDDGRLNLVGHQPVLGKTPRHFVIDPSGKFILVANQDDGTIVIFRMDGETGLLQPTGQTVKTPTPVCLQFLT